MARPWHWVDPCLVSILTPWIPCSCSVCASTAATDSRLAVTCLPVAESHSVCLAVWSLFHGKCSLVGVTSYTWTCHYDRPIIRPFPQTSDPSKFPFFSLQFLIKKPHQCHPTISSSVIPFFFPTFNLSQHQDLFQWVSSSHQVAKVLEFQLQHQSFHWKLRTDLL